MAYVSVLFQVIWGGFRVPSFGTKIPSSELLVYPLYGQCQLSHPKYGKSVQTRWVYGLDIPGGLDMYWGV